MRLKGFRQLCFPVELPNRCVQPFLHPSLDSARPARSAYLLPLFIRSGGHSNSSFPEELETGGFVFVYCILFFSLMPVLTFICLILQLFMSPCFCLFQTSGAPRIPDQTDRFYLQSVGLPFLFSMLSASSVFSSHGKRKSILSYYKLMLAAPAVREFVTLLRRYNVFVFQLLVTKFPPLLYVPQK